MKTVKEGVLRGTFAGFNGVGTLFEFSDGDRWRQVCENVHAKRAFMPEARIMALGEKYYIKVNSIDLEIEVVPHVLS